MSKLIQKLQSQVILRSLVLIAGGVVLIVFPSATQNTIAYTISIIMVVIGVINLITYFHKREDTGSGYKEYNSPVNLILGIAFILLAGVIAKFFISFVPVVLGVLILISGLLKLDQAIDMKKTGKHGETFVLVMAIISILVGLFAIFNPFAMGNVLLRIAGVGLVYSGLSDLFASGFAGKKVEIMKDDDLRHY